MDRSPLRPGVGSDTGAAHGYFVSHRRQAVLLSIVAELPLEKHPALLYGAGVVVVALHGDWPLAPAWSVLDEDAS